VVAPTGLSARRLLGPREGRAEMALVRRLVLAEARIAIDAERRALRVGQHRHAACLEALGEGRDHGLERLLEQALVFGLAWLEPGAVVVHGQVGEELDGRRR